MLAPTCTLHSALCPCPDYEKVITHCIQHSNYTEALRILTDKAAQILKLPEKELRTRFKPFAELFYKFSPALVKRCARDTVDAWIKMGRHLEPHKLIPALIQCNQPVDSAQVSLPDVHIMQSLHNGGKGLAKGKGSAKAAQWNPSIKTIIKGALISGVDL